MPTDSWSLCGNCLKITPSDKWIGLDYAEGEDEPRPVPFDDPHFLKCPYCEFLHTDDDADPGVWEGSNFEMYQQWKVIHAEN